MTIRVAAILDSFSLGGTERNAVRVLAALDQTRFSGAILALRDGPLRSVAAAAGLAVAVPAPRGSRRQALVAFLRAHRPHVVHTQDRYANPLGVLAKAVWPSARLVVSRRWSEGYGSPRSAVANWVAAHVASRIVANSEWSAGAARHGLVIHKGRVVVIPNYVEQTLLEAEAGPAARAEARAALGIPDEAFLVVAVGNLRSVKGHDVLIRSLVRCADSPRPIYLIIVGEGPERPSLERLVAASGLANRVRLVGHGPPLQWLVAADLCALASWSESSPNALLEAMALARPVLATAVGGIPSLLEEGRTGWLFPPGDVAAAAAALAWMSSRPGQLAAAGAEGRRIATARYSAAAVLPLWERLYEGVR